MYSRRRLDISWSDLGSTLLSLIDRRSRAEINSSISNFVGASVYPLLSVRTAFDLLLQVLKLPAGSEVIMTAVTIRDMASIVEKHALKVVPLDIELHTLAPTLKSFQDCLTEQTKLVVLAPLFGSIIESEGIKELCKVQGILLVQDLAQAYAGPKELLNTKGDIVLASFGPIKTNTALGGALIIARDQILLNSIKAIEQSYAEQNSLAFFKKVLRFSLIKAISYRAIFAWLVSSLAFLGIEADFFLSRIARGFPANVDLLNAIRKRPALGLLKLLERRLANFDPDLIQSRTKLAEQFSAKLHKLGITTPGLAAERHTHWAFAIIVDQTLGGDPKSVVQALRAIGLDATQGASNLVAVTGERGKEDQEEEAPSAKALLQSIVYLPCYAEIPERVFEQAVEVLSSFRVNTRSV